MLFRVFSLVLKQGVATMGVQIQYAVMVDVPITCN